MTPALDLGFFRRRGVQIVRQTEMAECGLASLVMIANFHGFDIDLPTARQRFQPSLRGASLQTLIAVSDRMGLGGRAVKLSLDQLSQLHVPAILHWDMSHFVVLERVRRGKALVHDPEGRSRWLPLSEVSDHFTGVALELRPTDNFEPEVARKSLRLCQLWRRITGLKRALVQTIVLSLIMQAFVLASPYYMQVAIDNALPALDRDLLAVLAIGFGLFTLINAGATLLRAFVLLSAGAALGFGIASNLGRHLLKLPIDWFERRHVGDVLSRFQSISPIREFLTEGAVSTLLDGSLTIFTLLAMFFLNVKLSCVALAAFGLYLLVRLVSFSAQRDAQEELIVTSGREQSIMIESLRGILTLRLSNKEAVRQALWQSKLSDTMNATAALSRVMAWQNAANTLIFGLEIVASVWIAISLVLDGGFSVGMVFAYIAYKTQFLQRSSSLIEQVISFRMLGLHLDRLADVALTPADPSFTTDALPMLPPLKGRVELRNVSFRYSFADPLVLDGVNLVIEPGEHVAITGTSGGGKTTLVKIMLGLVEPSGGEVLIDDMPLRLFGVQNFHDQLGAVMQNDSLFAGSLADNIALFQDAPDRQRVIAAATAAALHEDILAMPMGYETLVGDMGSTLSGGQKQRVLLARAIYRQPRILVMDEGTSHLDVPREQAVNASVAAMGITRIVIAHRMETVSAAEKIFSLTDGKIRDVTSDMEVLAGMISFRANAPKDATTAAE